MMQAEQEDAQQARVALERAPLMDYAADLHGSRDVVADTAAVRHRAVLVSPDDAGLDELRAKLRLIGRGRLWMQLDDETERWCLARAVDLGSYQVQADRPLQTGVTIEFVRLSDWYAADKRLERIASSSSPAERSIIVGGTIPTRRVTVTLRPEPIQSSLIVPGTVITDSLRSQTTPAHFDGRAPESSVGIWRGTTNLVTNGSFETNTNEWQGDAGVTLARDTTTAQHGTASLRVTTDGTVSDQGAWTPPAGTYMAVSANQPYTVSCWLRGSGTVFFKIAWYDSANTWIGDSNGTSIALSSSWQRYAFTATAPLNAAKARIGIRTTSTQATTFWIDAVQFEQLSFPTPYVHTNGATASRSTPAMVIPWSLLGLTGWVAARIRVSSGSLTPVLARAGSTSGGFVVSGNSSLKRWMVSASGGTGSGSVSTTIPNWNPGQAMTVVAAWQGSSDTSVTTAKISVDGQPFASGTMNVNWSVFGPDLNIGGLFWSLPSYLNGELLWFACGTGTLTDADAAALAALGDTDPQPSDFPAVAQLTGLWTCRALSTSIVKPKVTNSTTGTSIMSTRTFTSYLQRLQIDTASYRVRYSNDGGQTWSDDWVNVQRGAIHVDLFTLAGGTNLIRCEFDPLSTDPALWTEIEWYDAYA